MLPYPLVIFDFDGTLCATEEAIHYSFKQTFQQKGITPPSSEEISAAVKTGGNLADLLPLLHPPLQANPGKKELQEWVLLYRHIYDTDGGRFTTLFAGVDELLPHLQKHGISCGVLSNKGQRAIEDALHKFGLHQYFDFIMGDNPLHPVKLKPHPMAYEQVIKACYLQHPAASVLMVGDTKTDLLFARHAGLSSCWAAYGYGEKDACMAAKPNFTIQSVEQLYPILLPEA